MSTSNRREQIAADIPESLRDADEALTRYGRWAMDRWRKRVCASAEGRYRTPPNDDDRQPREVLLTTADAMLAQRALARVSAPEREVLVAFYIPQRTPAHVIIRQLRIPPRMVRERHLLGLRQFSNIHQGLTARGIMYTART